jgi:hypothetical protein
VTDNIIPFDPQRRLKKPQRRREYFLQNLNDLIVESIHNGTPPQLIIRYMRDGAKAVSDWCHEKNI